MKGKNPPAATFISTRPHANEKVTPNSTNSTLESMLKQVEQLSQGERDTLVSAIYPHELDTLDIDGIILERSKEVVLILLTLEKPLGNHRRLRGYD